MDELPITLLGIRSAWRVEPDCSPAELVYGTTLLLPGEFLNSADARSAQPSSNFLQRLQASMRSALPPPPCYHGSRTSHVPTNLGTTGYVYVRCDARRSPLQRPYSGPYNIIHQHAKRFTLNINGRSVNVSIDRLKTAFVAPLTDSPTNTSSTSQEPQPPATTRSGRIIREPDRFLDHFYAP